MDHFIGYIIIVVLYLQSQLLSHKQLRYAIIILVNILYLHLYIVSMSRYIESIVVVSQATEFPCLEIQHIIHIKSVWTGPVNYLQARTFGNWQLWQSARVSEFHTFNCT